MCSTGYLSRDWRFLFETLANIPSYNSLPNLVISVQIALTEWSIYGGSAFQIDYYTKASAAWSKHVEGSHLEARNKQNMAATSTRSQKLIMPNNKYCHMPDSWISYKVQILKLDGLCWLFTRLFIYKAEFWTISPSYWSNSYTTHRPQTHAVIRLVCIHEHR